MLAPVPVDISNSHSWPGFTISGCTGELGTAANADYKAASGSNGVYYVSADGFQKVGQTAPNNRIWRIYGDVGLTVLRYTAAAAADYPWQVASWTPASGVGGTPDFERRAVPPQPVEGISLPDPVPATLSTTGDSASNAKALLTAVPPGRLGNSIRYRQVNPGVNNAAATISLNGFDITVNLATGSGGAITTTGTQRNALINGYAATAALVSAANLTGNTGAGIVSAFGFASLTGGLGGLPPAPEPVPL